MNSSRKTKAALQAAPDLHAQLGLRPGQSIELLKELHILTRDGRLNQDSRRKLKQVNHLLQFIEKVRQELPPREGGLLLADHGAGKSYLGFMLYDLCAQGTSQGANGGICMALKPALIWWSARASWPRAWVLSA